MKKVDLTTKINLKIIGVVLLLMITVATYNQWLLVQEEKEENIRSLTMITDFLVKKKPTQIFSEFAARQDLGNQAISEQVFAMNKELQPIVDSILVPTDTVKFGFYWKKPESVVAIGPHYDASLLVGIDSGRFSKIYETDTGEVVEIKNSLIWHGADSISYIRPVEENGVIVGHAFATMNKEAVRAMIWKRTINSFFGTFLMLLICVAVFRELFVKVKLDLQVFSEKILGGNTNNFNSEVVEFSPVFQSISEQTEKMIRLDRLNIIGEMAAGIAHEIRNPMTTVKGLLQFIGNKQEFAIHKANFDLMIEEIDRANSIITEFLSLAKNRSMEFSEKNLNDIIQDIYPLLQADAVRSNCDIALALGDVSNVSVDPNSIRQLIFNLVRNGLDAMPVSGSIHISTVAAGSKVLLSVKDCGSGISPEILDKIGTPFFTTKEKGTGLGLAICYRIAQRHGATITVESKLGKGTVFTIGFSQV